MATWLGDQQLVVVDGAPAMVRQARTRFGLCGVVADARALPFSDGAFSTALCATGVLEYLPDDQVSVVLGQLGRSCGETGTVVLAASCSRSENLPPLRAGHAIARRGVDVHGRLDQWLRCFDRASTSDRVRFAPYFAIAEELGDPVRAHVLLRRALPEVEALVDFDAMTTVARRLGFSVVETRYRADAALGLWRLGGRAVGRGHGG